MSNRVEPSRGITYKQMAAGPKSSHYNNAIALPGGRRISGEKGGRQSAIVKNLSLSKANLMEKERELRESKVGRVLPLL